MGQGRRKREFKVIDAHREVENYLYDTCGAHEAAAVAVETSDQLLAMLEESRDPDPSLLERLNSRAEEELDTVYNAHITSYRSLQVGRSIRDNASNIVTNWSMDERKIGDYRPKTFGDLVDEMDSYVDQMSWRSALIDHFEDQVEMKKARIPEPGTA